MPHPQSLSSSHGNCLLAARGGLGQRKRESYVHVTMPRKGLLHQNRDIPLRRVENDNIIHFRGG